MGTGSIQLEKWTRGFDRITKTGEMYDEFDDRKPGQHALDQPSHFLEPQHCQNDMINAAQAGREEVEMLHISFWRKGASKFTFLVRALKGIAL